MKQPKFITIIIFLLIFPFIIFAQKEANIWYFGNKAGLDFNSGTPVPLLNSGMFAYGGCTSISDQNGDIQFYTNGTTVYNKAHQEMYNGTGLMGDWYYGNYGQSVIAVPRPNYSSYYYIFSVNRKQYTTSTYPDALRYSRVYMLDQGGLGSVNNRNLSLKEKTFDARITSVKHRNGKDYWVIVRETNTNKFYAYLVTDGGPNSSSVNSNAGRTTITPYTWWGWNGSMKASPDGKHLVYSTQHNYSYLNPYDSVYLELFDFDDSTGVISNPVPLKLPNYDWYWWNSVGVEYSPDGSKLYVTDYATYYYNYNQFKLYQFDLDAGSPNAISNSLTKVADVNYGYWGWWYNGNIQLGPDGKIYVARYNNQYLSVVNAPNHKGLGSCFQDSAVYLGGRTTYNGLPNFVTSWFHKEVFDVENVCQGDTAIFKINHIDCLDSARWNFGDPTSGNLNTSDSWNTIHIYENSGTYNVSLILYRKGIPDTTIEQIRIYPRINMNAYLPDTSMCLYSNYFEFSDSSTLSNGSIVSRIWDMGDGTVIDTVQDSNHVYANHGIFQLKLLLETNKGCRDSIVRDIYVNPEPKANFGINDITQCLNENKFIFTDSNQIAYGSLEYLWDFGDTSMSSATGDTNHIYNQYDTFEVKLLVTSNMGCVDDTIKTIHVHPSPITNFDINNNSQCLNLNSFLFSNSSYVYNDTLTYFWDFGNGNSSTLLNPSQVYNAADTFKVSLVSKSSLGCPDTLTKDLFVHPTPQVSFDLNDSIQCWAVNEFEHYNNSNIASGTLTYLWTFGDGNSSSSVNPIYSYGFEDTFRVSLIATSDQNCIDSTFRTAYVLSSPVAGFMTNDNKQCFNENYFSFTNTSQINYGSMSYVWTLGDGTTNTDINQNYVYSLPGSFPVKLMVTSSLNCKDSAETIVTIDPSPKSKFSIVDSQQCFNGNSFTYLNNSSIDYGSITYNWDFDDGQASTSINPVYSFTYDDTFNIKLLATSDQGCEDSVIHKSYVFPNPIPKFSINDTSQCFERNTFIYYNNSKINTGSMSFLWDLGDGTITSNYSPVHHYNIPDTFNVKLVATSNLGCSDSIEKTTLIHVHPMPNALFTILDSGQCLSGNQFDLTNYSNISNGSFTSEWVYGDSTSEFNTNATHSFLNHDTFEIKLRVTSNWGCIDSFLKNVVVYPMPLVDFSHDTNSLCLSGNVFNLTNNTTIPSGQIQTYLWDFGNGTTSSSTNYVITYNTPDTFDVQLKATSLLGCLDSNSKKLYVHPMPVADFTIDDDVQCLDGNDFLYIDKSTISSGVINKFNWDFGDLNTSIKQDPNHIYSKIGDYTVKFLATSSLGCKDSITKQVFVKPMPSTDFNINSIEQCLNNNKFIFINKSKVISGNIDTFNWSFGDGSTSTNENPIYSYSLHNEYNVNLTTITDYGCSDDTSKKVIVRPNPNNLFTINNDKQCIKYNKFIFTNQSTVDYGFMTYLWTLGDGTSDTSRDVSHKYSKDTSLTVKLVVSSNIGCKDSTELPVVIHPMPVSDFEYTQICLDENISFTDLSTINNPDKINQWYWDFTNNTSTVQNPDNMFITPGSKNIMQVVGSDNNCFDTSFQQVYVNEHVIAPKMIRVTVEDEIETTNTGYIHLEWEEVTVGDPMNYIVQRSTNGLDYISIATIDKQTFEYDDYEVRVDEKEYYYRILLMDSCNFISPLSNENEGKSILLSVNDSFEYPSITWTPYKGWLSGISFYDLNLYNENAMYFELVEQIPSNIEFYIDEKSNIDQANYCYQIVAYNNDDNSIESKSNTICVPTTFYVWVPNAFSPNGDGINDEFIIKGKNVIDFDISIYNRWGEQVYYSNDIHKGWNGNFQNTTCQAGVYVFILNAKGTDMQKQRVNGTVTLIR